MPDISTITAVLSGLKNATDIAKILSDSNASLEKAELKMRLAELYESLANARIAAVDLKDELREKDDEIARLLAAVSLGAELVKAGDAYFKKNAEGAPTGDPFCVFCWDQKKALVHIHERRTPGLGRIYRCPRCTTEVDARNIPWGVIK